ncbi:hypothetical protein NY904_004465 [Escherichia coli]|nr:hypothetical protein [Escherichia coli]
MAMPNITNVLNADVQSRITSYHTLAEKAVKNDDSSTGVFAALERFFYKLDFLLKYGHLPATNDTEEGGGLPPELQKLQSFLEAGKTGKTFVLQRNATERFRFRWQNDGKLTVAEEKLHVSPAKVRAGYVSTGEWRTHTTTQNVESCFIQQTFKSFIRDSFISLPDFYWDGKKTEMEDSTNRIPISERYFSINNKLSSVLMSQRVDKIVEQIKEKKYSKTFYREKNYIPKGRWFDSCIKDINRTPSIIINGVELKQNTFCKIKHAIYGNGPLSKVTQVNVSPLNEETVFNILSDLKDEKEKRAVEPILKSPQFIFAVLSGLSQSLASQFDPLLKNNANLALNWTNYLKKDGLNSNQRDQLENDSLKKIQDPFYDNYKLSISMDDKQNLQCHLGLIILVGDQLNETDLIVGAHKVGLFYPVPRNFALGTTATMNIDSTLEAKLQELLPGMHVKIASLE